MNNTMVSNAYQFISEKTSNLINDLQNLILDKVPDTWLGKVIIAFLIVLLIYIASKVTNKIAKVVLWILAIILVLGIIFSFVPTQ